VVGGVVLRTAAAFALTKLSAAFLGPEEFARYGHYLMLASYLLTASSLGLSNAFTVHLVRRGVRDGATPASLHADVTAVVQVGAISGAAVAVALTVLLCGGWTGTFLPRIARGELLPWILFCLSAGAGNAFQAAVLAQQKHRLYQLIATSIPLLSCASLAAAVSLSRLTAERAISCYMLGFLVPAGVYLIRGRSVRLAHADSLRAVLRFAAPYVLPSLLVPTVGALGTLAVRHTVSASASTHDLGLWQALWRLAEAYMGVLVSIGTQLFVPRLSRAANREEARREVWRASLGALALYAPVAACWLLVPRLTLRLLLAPAFVGIESLLPIQIVGDVLKILCSVLVLTCTALLRPGLTLLAEVLFSCVFFGLAVLLTPAASAAGAVSAYACAYGVLFLVLLPLVRKTVGSLPE
jgi:O-antigen/teichoic acid export membrane protein